MEMKFIADVHLGKLARLLRLLGFDTVYKNLFTNTELVNIAHDQSRVLLTRNTSLATNRSINCFVINSEDALRQLAQVVDHFKLANLVQPFTRCLVCNGELHAASKENVAHLLEENTFACFDEFWQCSNCKRIYWKGSHYEGMLQLIEAVRMKQ